MKLTVFCASSGLVGSQYLSDAHKLGELIGEAGHTLINGAGRTGLMAAVADGCLEKGGKAIGVIPQFMIDRKWQHTGMSELIVTQTMGERKDYMMRESDACIALPGGVGTLEELFEIVTLKQLGRYDKPIILLNTDGFYNDMLHFIRHIVEENFMHAIYTTLWKVALTPEEAVRMAVETPVWTESVDKYAAL